MIKRLIGAITAITGLVSLLGVVLLPVMDNSILNPYISNNQATMTMIEISMVLMVLSLALLAGLIIIELKN